MKIEERNKVLEEALIPKEWWDLCTIDENCNIFTPSRGILYKNGLCTEEEYQQWLKVQEPQPAEIEILKEELEEANKRSDLLEGKINTLELENSNQENMIFTTMDATTELNESNISNAQMVLISMDALTEINEQLIALQEQITVLKGGVK